MGMSVTVLSETVAVARYGEHELFFDPRVNLQIALEWGKELFLSEFSTLVVGDKEQPLGNPSRRVALIENVVRSDAIRRRHELDSKGAGKKQSAPEEKTPVIEDSGDEEVPKKAVKKAAKKAAKKVASADA